MNNRFVCYYLASTNSISLSGRYLNFISLWMWWWPATSFYLKTSLQFHTSHWIMFFQKGYIQEGSGLSWLHYDGEGCNANVARYYVAIISDYYLVKHTRISLRASIFLGGMPPDPLAAPCFACSVVCYAHTFGSIYFAYHFIKKLLNLAIPLKTAFLRPCFQ